MRSLIERIAEKHTVELSEAKDGIEKPWTIDGSQWMSLKGVKQPWAFEISPMQYARMGKSQKAAHDKKRAAEWQASMDAKKDWADAVLAASKSGEFDVGDKDVHPEAKSVVRRGKMAADKEKEADLLSRAEKDNEIQSASDLKVGDRVFSVMARGYVTVEKVAKKSIRVAGARGSVKQDVKYLRWLSNDDMKSAALGEDIANSSSSDVYPSPLGEKEFKMRELIERIASLKEADVYSITDFSKAENPSGEAQALAASVRKEIEKHMPPGVVLKCEVVRYLGRKSIHVTTALEKDLSKVANRIRDNDRALQTFYIDGVNDDDTLKDKLTATISRGDSLTVKPEPGSYYAFGHVKFGWRKKSGTPDQIVKHFGNYFKKVKKVIQDNKDMMPEGIETGTMRGLIEKSIERLEGTGKEFAQRYSMDVPEEQNLFEYSRKMSAAAAKKIKGHLVNMGYKVDVLSTDGWGLTPMIADMGGGLRVPIHVGIQDVSKKGSEIYIQLQSPISMRPHSIASRNWKIVASVAKDAMKSVKGRFAKLGDVSLPANSEKWPTIWLTIEKGQEREAMSKAPDLAHAFGYALAKGLARAEFEFEEDADLDGTSLEEGAKGKVGSHERKLIGETQELISTFVRSAVNAYEHYDSKLEPFVNALGPAFVKDVKAAGTSLVSGVMVSQGGKEVIKGYPFSYIVYFTPRPKLPRNNDFEWKEKEAAYEEWMKSFGKDMKILESFGLKNEHGSPKVKDYGRPVEWWALRDVANL